jgi:hypothetical protein
VKVVVWLWFVLGAALLAGAAPFSHKLHLGMGLTCVGCHAAASSSTRAADDLLPTKQVCAGCHDPSIAPQRPPALPVPVVHFSHAVHLKMGSVAPFIARAIDKGTYLQPSADVRKYLDTKNACQACHRGLEESDRVTAAALPKMADCLVCHPRIVAPWTCEDCHARSAPLKPETHRRETFFDSHSKGAFRTERSTCAVCHGREFTCMGCH